MTFELTEEQRDEYEALESIYPDEFEGDTSADDKAVYSLKLVPDQSAEPEVNHVSILLKCIISPSYPEDVPSFEVEVLKGLSARQVEEIVAVADAAALENQGMASIFTVGEAVREWLVDHNIEGQDGSMYADMMRRMNEKDAEKKKEEERKAVARAADEEVVQEEELDEEELERLRKRQAGVPVSEESFLEWKMAFEAEMRAKATATSTAKAAGTVSSFREKDGASSSGAGSAAAASGARLTGKQLFQTNRAGMEDALLAAAEGDGPEVRGEGAVELDGPDAVAVSEDLFLDDDDDDIDLDDLELSDEEDSDGAG